VHEVREQELAKRLQLLKLGEIQEMSDKLN
jgi:hypothetical protein